MKCYDWNLKNKNLCGNIFKFNGSFYRDITIRPQIIAKAQQFSELQTLTDEGITFFRKFGILFLSYAASYSGKSKSSNTPI
jgi:hypothetical protein